MIVGMSDNGKIIISGRHNCAQVYLRAGEDQHLQAMYKRALLPDDAKLLIMDKDVDIYDDFALRAECRLYTNSIGLIEIYYSKKRNKLYACLPCEGYVYNNITSTLYEVTP